MNGMDGRLHDLLDAAVGEPPHQVTAAAVRRRVIRRRVVEAVAGAVAVVVIAAIALVGVRTLGHTPSPAPATRPHPTAHIITSRHYHYAETLPAGWRLVGQATQQWDGAGPPATMASSTCSWDLAASRHGRTRHRRRRPGGLHQNDHAGRHRRASMPGEPAIQPGHHDRRGTRPAAGRPCPARSGFLVESRSPSMTAPHSCSDPRTRPGPKPATAPPFANGWPESGSSLEGSPTGT